MIHTYKPNTYEAKAESQGYKDSLGYRVSAGSSEEGN